MTEALTKPTDYPEFLHAIKSRIWDARIAADLSALRQSTLHRTFNQVEASV